MKTNGPKPPEKDVEMIDLEPDKTKTKGPTAPPPATSQSKFNGLRYRMSEGKVYKRMNHCFGNFYDHLIFKVEKI